MSGKRAGLGLAVACAILTAGGGLWAQEREVPAWEKEIDAKLSEVISVAFDGTELTKALQYFRDRTKVNIILDLEEPKHPGTAVMPRVTLKLDGVQAESALAWTVRLAGLTYVVRDEAVYVAPEVKVDPEWRQAMWDRYARRMSDLKTGWLRQIELKMQGPIDVNYHNDPVDRVGEDIALKSVLNIVVDAESAKTAKLVGFQARQMTVENVLKWVTKLSGMKYVMRDEVVYIASQANMAKLQLETGTAGLGARFVQPVTFEFKDMELTQALRNLQQRSGVKIELPKLPAEEHRVTVSGKGLALDAAVRLVLDRAGLAYAISYRTDAMVVMIREKSEKSEKKP